MEAQTKNCQNCKNDFVIESEDFKFYERFQHTIIKQDTSKMTQKIIL